MARKDSRLYVSTACLSGDRGLERVLKEYRSAGLENVEISAPHLYVPIDELADMLVSFSSSGMGFIFHNYFPPPEDDFVFNPVSRSEDVLKRSRQLVRSAVGLAQKVGANLYSCHPGYLCDAFAAKSGKFSFDENNAVSRDEGMEMLKSDFAPFCNALEGLAPEKGRVFMALENLFPPEKGENYSLLCTMDEISGLFDSPGVKDSDIGLLIDLGHLSVSSNIMGFDKIGFMDKAIEKYGDRIYEIHLSDNDGRSDLHDCIRESSWQLTALGRFRETGARLGASGTRICVESRGLKIGEIVKCRDMIKEAMEGF